MTDNDLIARIDAWQFDPKRNDMDTWRLLCALRAALATPQEDTDG